jgi:hypothetical protein
MLFGDLLSWRHFFVFGQKLTGRSTPLGTALNRAIYRPIKKLTVSKKTLELFCDWCP